jgi:hypothetical protein
MVDGNLQLRSKEGAVDRHNSYLFSSLQKPAISCIIYEFRLRRILNEIFMWLCITLIFM